MVNESTYVPRYCGDDYMQLCQQEFGGKTIDSTEERPTKVVESLEDYSQAVDERWFYDDTSHGCPELAYLSTGLAEEAGEFCGKVKKFYRDQPQAIWPSTIQRPMPTAEQASAMIKELGDVLFYLTRAATMLGFTLEDVARTNLNKIDSRRNRGTLRGSGDDR